MEKINLRNEFRIHQKDHSLWSSWLNFRESGMAKYIKVNKYYQLHKWSEGQKSHSLSI